MFIGREEELRFLEEAYEKPGGQLIFLYGRRRVGKTETLHQFAKGKDHIFHTCNIESDAMQLQKFSSALLKHHPAGKYIQSFGSWSDAFSAIADVQSKGKKLIIIDEFPYIVKRNRAIPSYLQEVWDEVLKNENVMIVICGSAMSFIEKDILSEKNPLYGRATGIYKMLPLPFVDVCRFFPNYSMEEKIQAYSILGGVPLYLQEFDDSLTIEENIKKSILTKGRLLYSETDFLLRQEVREPGIYHNILVALAAGNTKIGDISEKTLIHDTSKTSKYLSALIELGLVERELSVDAGPKVRSNLNNGIYKIKDPFFQFWFRFVFDSLSMLEDRDVDGMYEEVIENSLDRYTSFIFEDICRQYVMYRQKENTLPFRVRHLGRWMGKTTVRRKKGAYQTGQTGQLSGHKDDDQFQIQKSKEVRPALEETEIDLMGMNREKHKLLVGECKYKHSAFSYGEFLDLQTKVEPLMTENEVLFILFSKSGFSSSLTEKASENVMLIGMQDFEDWIARSTR